MKSKSKVMLIMEKFLVENGVQLFEPTKEGAMEFGAELKVNIHLPIVNCSVGALGRPDTLYATFGFEPKEKWASGIFQNSKYFKMTITTDGVMEVFSSDLSEKSKNPYKVYDQIPVKFRKTKAKNSADAIAKIQKFIKAVKDYYHSIGTPIEESIQPPTLKESGDNKQAIADYVEKLNKAEKEHFEKQGYTLEPSVFDAVPGKRWVKITTTTYGGKGSRSVFAFVDPTTGDIYKPAGWNAPAKGVRGNVNDANPPLRAGDLYRYR